RDLHDTVGQNVSYLRMRLDHLKETNLQTQLDLKTEIANMLNVANESYNLLRGTMDMLQSGGVDDLGNLMTQYATQVEKRRQFKILLSNLGESRHLSTNEVRQLFFVYREALNNIEKYADASKVLVELDWADEYLIMTISDDGNGFNLEDEPIRNHYGLKFMQERIESINGVFSIQSFIGKGTSIKITLPLKKQQPV
ncbi:MAG: ATP-binding protein, partial [Anaerolineales bacterium]